MSKKIRALEKMPKKAKLIYTEILLSQILIDEEVSSKKVSDIYVFMSQISLGADKRERIRGKLVSGDIDVLSKIPELFLLITDSKEQKAIKFSLIKDLVRVSKVDGDISFREKKNIKKIANKLYSSNSQKDEIINLAKEAVENDEKLLKGELSIDEFEKGAKELAAKAGGIGIPVAAVYLSGSVVGLSAAGITSGLAALGAGGILGLSSMLTGIGAVIGIGILTYKAGKWLLGGKERELEEKRENMIKEIISLHQKAINSLAEDINNIAEKLERYLNMKNKNEKELNKLRKELETFKNALNQLERRKEKYA